MLEIKDPAIKLFGWKIQLLADDEAPVIESVDLGGDTAVKLQGKAEQEEVIRKQTDATDSDNSPNQESIPDTNSDNPQTPSIDEEATKPNNSKTEKEQSDSNNSKETKTLKKPDKILPCPRCNSMETKFCYYNNYNVSQPRHFCKACQRYWTAGGSMRNVPVGAGRRKTKNSSSTTSLFHHQISIPEALQNGKKGQVLSFSTSLELDDAPISDSMASVLNLADKKNNNSNASNPCSKTRDDCSSVTDSIDEGVMKCAQEPPSSNELFPSQVPCIPWPYPWNSAGLTSGYCTPNIPVSFYPSGYWIPWFPQQPAASPTSLGKHSRECDVLEEPSPKQKAGNVLVPKTLRIDDPNEAAKSSIWATLGIKNDSVNGGGLFKPFQSKSHEKNHLVESSPVLRANPAAFSRSLKFQESS